MLKKTRRLFLLCLLAIAIAAPPALCQPPAAPAAPAAKKKRSKEDPAKRAKSLRAIADHLDVGAGAVIADIGAGGGRDTWTFADIVGESGKVYSEEIAKDKVDKIKEEAEKRGLSQVKPVLGKDTDPALPAASVDMAFMHYVYHHVAKPHEMLKGIWKALKPGGYFVIVDQRLGTLVDWVPRADRAKKHYWIAETTVVRDARENGFAFVECAESSWHTKGAFVLVLQRPVDLDAPDRDPDPLPAIPADTVRQVLPPADEPYQRIAFVALGEGRKLIGPILKASPCDAVDIVLEEWATTKDERPALPENVELPSVLTEKGDPHLGPEPVDAVYFLDTYHLLFHGPALLAQLRERLTDSGRIYVLDRAAPDPIPHRLASHRRMIAPDTVKQEMAEAGFALLREAPKSTDHRFLLVFGKTDVKP
jgi:predicted methyltransferase